MNDIFWSRDAVPCAKAVRALDNLMFERACGLLLRNRDLRALKPLWVGPELYEVRERDAVISFSWFPEQTLVIVWGCRLSNARACASVPEQQVALIPQDVVLRVLRGAPCVRAWREHLRVTQRDLAERLGVSQPTLSVCERTEPLSDYMLTRLAAALNVTKQQLVF